MLLDSSNAHLSIIVCDRLIPASHALDQPVTEFHQVGALGKTWVNLGLALFELYLPNIHFYPAVAENCTFTLWKDREAEVSAQNPRVR
jgi:hypothetical protein